MQTPEEYTNERFSGIEKETWYPVIVAVADSYAKYVALHDLPFEVVKDTILKLQKGQRSTLFQTWQFDIEALRELCFVMGYADDTLNPY